MGRRALLSLEHRQLESRDTAKSAGGLWMAGSLVSLGGVPAPQGSENSSWDQDITLLVPDQATVRQARQQARR